MLLPLNGQTHLTDEVGEGPQRRGPSEKSACRSGSVTEGRRRAELVLTRLNGDQAL